jgi:hypothetical protein
MRSPKVDKCLLVHLETEEVVGRIKLISRTCSYGVENHQQLSWKLACKIYIRQLACCCDGMQCTEINLVWYMMSIYIYMSVFLYRYSIIPTRVWLGAHDMMIRLHQARYETEIDA